jgi:hypothetical protein
MQTQATEGFTPLLILNAVRYLRALPALPRLRINVSPWLIYPFSWDVAKENVPVFDSTIVILE